MGSSNAGEAGGKTLAKGRAPLRFEAIATTTPLDPGSQSESTRNHAAFIWSVDLSGHHSNPPAPLEALLNGACCDAETRCEATEDSRTCALGSAGGAVLAAHPRQGRIIDAISQVLTGEGDPMRARDVHARVETLLGEPYGGRPSRQPCRQSQGPGPQIRPSSSRTLPRPRRRARPPLAQCAGVPQRELRELIREEPQARRRRADRYGSGVARRDGR